MALGDVVQSGSVNISTGHTATLGIDPTEGNTLVIWIGLRNLTDTSAPVGFTSITDYVQVSPHDGDQPFRGRAYYRVVGASDTNVVTFTDTGTTFRRLQYVELEGALAVDTFATNPDGTDYSGGPTQLLSCGTLTAGTTAIVLVGGLVARLNVTDPFSAAVVGPASELADASGGQRVPMWLGYRKIDPASGSYTMEATATYGGLLRGALGFLVSFNIEEEDPDPPDPPDPPTDPDPAPGFWFPSLSGSGGGTDDEGPLARMLPEGDGDGGGDDTLANFTEWVIGARINQPGDRDHTGRSQASTMTVTLQNADGRWNPDNTGSPLYGLLRPGLDVWVGCLTDGSFSGVGTVKGLFGGFVKEIVPIAVPGGFDHTPTAELICIDPLEEYRERKARLEFSTERTIEDVRRDALLSADEDFDRIDLDAETSTVAWSGQSPSRGVITRGGTGIGSGASAAAAFARQKPVYPNLLALLEDLNHAYGTRHYIRPGDSKEEWYFYTTRLRQYNVNAAEADAWSGDDIVDATSYRSTVEGVVNTQEATIESAVIDQTPRVVWESNGPVDLAVGEQQEIEANYGDYVLDASLTIAATSGVSSSFTDYGNGALIALAATAEATVNTLRVTGRRLHRGSPVSVEKRDTTSLGTYRERAGSPIQSEYLQARGEAEGSCRFVVWKFAQPLKQPNVTFKKVTTLTESLNRGLYDVVTLSVDALDVSARRFEIVDRTVDIVRASAGVPKHIYFTFGLQETPNQSALSLFIAGGSTVGSTDVLGV